jgi:hypothetical protein
MNAATHPQTELVWSTPERMKPRGRRRTALTGSLEYSVDLDAKHWLLPTYEIYRREAGARSRRYIGRARSLEAPEALAQSDFNTRISEARGKLSWQ